jgi:hypothetical protein
MREVRRAGCSLVSVTSVESLCGGVSKAMDGLRQALMDELVASPSQRLSTLKRNK